MKKITGKQVKTGIAGILLAASVLCYCMGIGRGAEVRTVGDPAILADTDRGFPAESAETGVMAEDTGKAGAGAGSADGTGAGAPPDGNAGDTKVAESMAAPIYIHVCGAVQNPGVYELAGGSRACDAVEAAGGLTEDAAAELLNLAQVLTDGQQLRVPDQEEEKAMREAGLVSGSRDVPGSVASFAAEPALSSGKVNLNTASKEQLMTLSGIGEARAEAILAYRREAGPFLAIEEIMNVSGIKDAAFQKIKEDITV